MLINLPEYISGRRQKFQKEELIALQAAARIVLVAARGTLRQQLAATAPVATKPRHLIAGRQFREEPSAPLPFMELKYFNGLGGFTEDGKEFVIYLGRADIHRFLGSISWRTRSSAH